MSGGSDATREPISPLLDPQLAYVVQRLEGTMADIADDALGELRDAITGAMGRISDDVDEFTRIIQELRTELSEAGAARLQEVADRIRSEAQRIRTIDPDPAFPPPPEPTP